MCCPEHTHVAIQNSPDNVSIHYVWSIPLNSIPKSFPSLSIHSSFTFYQTVLMLVGVSSVLFVKWVCWWLGRVIMICYSMFPIHIIVDLCHFEPPKVQCSEVSMLIQFLVQSTSYYNPAGALQKRFYPLERRSMKSSRVLVLLLWWD